MNERPCFKMPDFISNVQAGSEIEEHHRFYVESLQHYFQRRYTLSELLWIIEKTPTPIELNFKRGHFMIILNSL